MSQPVVRKITPGVYCPTVTFFQADGDHSLDIPTLKKHVVYLARAGVWPLLSGGMGEGPHLDASERKSVIQATRSALDAAGLNTVPIIAGTGTHSLKETIQLTRDAATAGADAAIVIISGYYVGAINNEDALYDFWKEVADNSSIPIIIYNFPGATAGIDLDSELIIRLAQHPNIMGCKLTDGVTGKLVRIASVVNQPSFIAKYPRAHPQISDKFLVMAGIVESLNPDIFGDGHGAFAGLTNIAPYACKKLYDLSTQLKAKAGGSGGPDDLLSKTLALQGVVAQADRVMSIGGIAGTKYVLQKRFNYGGAPRRPLPPITANKGEELWNNDYIKALLAEEAKLQPSNTGS